MPDKCPRCHFPLPAPSARDFERMPTRDREAMLERAIVRKAPPAARAPIATVERTETGIRFTPRA